MSLKNFKTSKQISSSTLSLNKKWSGVAFPWLNEPIDNLQQSEVMKIVKGLRNWKHSKLWNLEQLEITCQCHYCEGLTRFSPLICIEFAITFSWLQQQWLKFQNKKTYTTSDVNLWIGKRCTVRLLEPACKCGGGYFYLSSHIPLSLQWQYPTLCSCPPPTAVVTTAWVVGSL